MAHFSSKMAMVFVLALCVVVLWIQKMGLVFQQGEHEQECGQFPLISQSPQSQTRQNTSTTTTTTSMDWTKNQHDVSLFDRVNRADLPRILAIYFPQFHPDPINDKNWGENFTDWTSLQAAPATNKLGLPLPHPIDHIYYDLRDYNVRQRQGQQARDYGIDGFVIHHYWFYDPQHPGPNLHAPLMRLLEDGEPSVPFLFNWCESSWSSVWTGKAQGQQKQGSANNPVVLQKQFWNPSDDKIKEHYQWLRQFWIHERYIRIGGHPVLMIYQWFPESVPILKRLRALATEDPAVGGLTIWMSRSATHPDLYDISSLPDDMQRVWKRKSQQSELLYPQKDAGGPLWNESVAYPYPHAWVSKAMQIPGWCQNPSIAAQRPIFASLEIPGIVTAFDNTPRRAADTALLYNIEKDPAQAVKRFRDSIFAAVYYETCCRRLTVYKPPADSRFILVNAWNEWAEGMTLEPSTTYGYGFLEAVRDVKAEILKRGCEFSDRQTNSASD